MRAFLTFLVALSAQALAQCPPHLPAHVSCTAAGGNIALNLATDAEITWPTFSLPRGSTLQITSGVGNASVHRVASGRALVGGAILADGPLTLVAPGGVAVSGEIRAPQVVLSSFQRGSDGAFAASRRAGALSVARDAQVVGEADGVSLIGRRIDVSGRISAPQGTVRVVGAESGSVLATQLPDGATDSVSARVQTRSGSSIEAPVVQIYSQGFFNNSGRIVAPLRLDIAARSIAHDARPGSVFVTSDLNTQPASILAGAVLDPNDGANPGGVSTTTEVPDLANGKLTGKRTTRLLPTQFSASTAQATRLPSVIRERRQSRRAALATRSTTQKKATRKRSFFGTVTTTKEE